MKITAKRQLILDALSDAAEALSARDLAARVEGVNQATVYRNLDAMTQEGLVHKFTPKGTEALYEVPHADHHHAICTDCDKVIHFHAPDKKLLELLELEDFDVESIEVTVRGKHNPKSS